MKLVFLWTILLVGTAIEHTLHDREAVDLNPARCWAFLSSPSFYVSLSLSLIVVSFIRYLKEEQNYWFSWKNGCLAEQLEAKQAKYTRIEQIKTILKVAKVVFHWRGEKLHRDSNPRPWNPRLHYSYSRPRGHDLMASASSCGPSSLLTQVRFPWHLNVFSLVLMMAGKKGYDKLHDLRNFKYHQWKK